MRLFKKDNIDDYIIPKDLSIGAIGMLNSLLVRTNDELENTDLYSLSNDSRKDVALAFRELRKKRYIIYNSLDDTYSADITINPAGRDLFNSFIK